MERIFKEHYKRYTESLNGDWKFCADKENIGVEEKWFESFPKKFRFVNVHVNKGFGMERSHR